MCGLPGGRVAGGATEGGCASLGSGTCHFAVLSVDQKSVFSHNNDMQGGDAVWLRAEDAEKMRLVRS